MSNRHFPHESGAERDETARRSHRLALLAVAVTLMLCGGSLVACGDQSSTAPSTSTTGGIRSSTSGVRSSTATPTTATGPTGTGTRSLPSNSQNPTPTASCPQPTHAVPVAVFCSSGQLVEQCPDGETVTFPPGCPGAGGLLRCPDGTIIEPFELSCPGETVPPGRPCADGSSVPEGGLCPEEVPELCPDGSTVPAGETCPLPTTAGPEPEQSQVSTGSAPSPPVGLVPDEFDSAP